MRHLSVVARSGSFNCVTTHNDPGLVNLKGVVVAAAAEPQCSGRRGWARGDVDGGALVAVEKPVPRDPPGTFVGPEVQAAVRRLVELANRIPDTNGDGVLVDLVIGGTRCSVTVGPQRQPACPVMADLLSPREQEIARMVASGCTNKEIASVLDISSWTVSTHLRRIFCKLDVTTRAAMVARLVDPGVVLRALPPIDLRRGQEWCPWLQATGCLAASGGISVAPFSGVLDGAVPTVLICPGLSG